MSYTNDEAMDLLKKLTFKVNSTKSELLREMASEIKDGGINLDISLADTFYEKIGREGDDDHDKNQSIWCFYHNIEKIIFEVDEMEFLKKLYYSKRELTKNEFYDFKEGLMNLITKYKIQEDRNNLESTLSENLMHIKSLMKKVYSIIEDDEVIFEDE